MAIKTYKRLEEVFVKGDLIRIDGTGEVFLYESSEGGANWTSYLTVRVGSVLVDYWRSLRVDDVSKLDSSHNVLDEFKEFYFKG